MQGAGPMPDYAPGPKRRKGLHPAIWVLIGFAGLLLLVMGGLVVSGIYLANRFSQDSAGAARFVLSGMDPDLEVEGGGDGSGTITIREKTSGKAITINTRDLKSSSFNFGKTGNFGTAGREVTVESRGSKITLGGGKLPMWIPAYPDARIKRWLSMAGPDGDFGAQTFETSDDAAKVLDYYEEAFRKSALEVTRAGTSIAARAPDGGRETSVKLEPDGEGSRVILNYTARD